MVLKGVQGLVLSPGGLLLVVGALLGANFPLGKLAGQAQVPGLMWALLLSLGTALVLGLALACTRPAGAGRLDAQHLRYFGIAALLSYALPNVLVLSCIPHLGSGMTAMLYTLSPLLTAVLARLAGLRRPARREYVGIALGFVGAVLVALARGEAGRPASWGWVGLGLLVPLLLALGNVYRSLDWPAEAHGTWLAVGSHTAAALMLAVACAVSGAWAEWPTLVAVPGLALMQVAAAAAMFPLYFRLQVQGGPVLLSQISIVGAGVGVLIGAGWLGERYAPGVWWGVALIAVGVGLTLWARRQLAAGGMRAHR